MAENQCPCYGKTPDWCKYKATILGTPMPVPYVPEGTQPGTIDSKICCSKGYCGKPDTSRNACSNEKVPPKLILVLEWYDRESDLIKKYTLTYHDVDKSAEITDIINHRRFLKRHVVDTVKLSELILGNVINIYGRQMTIVEYADSCTKQYMERRQEQAFLLVRPEAVQCLGQIYEVLERCFKVLRCRMAWFTRELANEFYKDKALDSTFPQLVGHVTSAPVVAFVLVAENAVEKLKELVGPRDPAVAKLKKPMSFRAMYGKNEVLCGFDISENPGCALRDMGCFFTNCRLVLPTLAPPAVIGKCSTLCLIKPHAVRKGFTGPIIYDIMMAGFKITGLELFYLDRTHAEELYEIYRGVLNEFSDMTEELSLGPCIAMEISGCGDKTHKAFREFVGPRDPILARKLRPNSLRAKYGSSTRVKNAIHCTDLEGDAEAEVEYFFKILQMME